MDAELIVVGSELLRPGFRDTNSTWLSDRLVRLGVTVRQIVLVGDDPLRIAPLVRAAVACSSVVLLTGGLGPTVDDRTREALSDALGAPLEADHGAEEAIRSFLRSRGRDASPEQLGQARRPIGTRIVPNPVGTAPGILSQSSDLVLAALPGVPAEMKAMFEATLAPILHGRSARVMRRRVLKVAGRTESWVDQRVRDLYATRGAEVTILAKASGVELVIDAHGTDVGEADARIEALDRAFAARLGQDLYGRDDDTLASRVGAALRSAGESVATAESCTAGLLGATLTEVPGSSGWYRGGVIAYADDLKASLAGVPEDVLAANGAVSAEVALELARGAKDRCGATWGLGVTGIAGPGGGTPEKPVGLVHLAVAGARGARAKRHLLGGDRDLVRKRSVTLALDLLRRALEGGA